MRGLSTAQQGLLALALVAVGSSPVEIGGQSVGSAVGGLLFTPAAAQKAFPKVPRIGGSGGRGRAGGFKGADLLPSLPLTHGFARLLPPKVPAPHKLPAFEPSPLKPLPSGGNLSPGKTVSKFSGKVAGLPSKSPAPQPPKGGWEPLVQPSPLPGKPKPPTAAPKTPLLTPGTEAKLPSAPFRRVLKRLRDERGPSKTSKKTADAKPGKTTADKKAAPPVPHRLGARRFGEPLPPVGTFKAQEVLALNLIAADLAKAKAGGFTVAGKTELPGLGITLTHLVPPPSLNAITAREQLFDLIPEGGFALNRVYAPYRLGSGRPSGASTTPVKSAGSGCPSERCFGSALIKWQPQLATCASGLKIGIVDTGFDKTHPALTGVRYEYKEFLPDGSAKASPEHGTGVLSLLAGKADSGTPGLIPDASFVIAGAFFNDDSGQPMSDTAQMVRALDWLQRSGVKVVNLSFAGPEDELVHHAVRGLTRSGAVVVAAAGNDGPGAPPSYPAAYEEVIAVTAVDRTLKAYRYAGRGAHIDLAAPGVDVWTAMPGRLEGPQTGTSFAVPYVTAVVAVALSGASPAPGSDALAPKRHALAKLHGSVLSLGGKGRDHTFGAGLVQAPETCEAPAPVVTASLTGPPSEPWSGTVKRALDDAPVPEKLAKGTWVATVRPVSGDGKGR